MKIRVLRSVGTADQPLLSELAAVGGLDNVLAYVEGSIHDTKDKAASVLIERGLAEKAESVKAQQPAKPETK